MDKTIAAVVQKQQVLGALQGVSTPWEATNVTACLDLPWISMPSPVLVGLKSRTTAQHHNFLNQSEHNVVIRDHCIIFDRALV